MYTFLTYICIYIYIERERERWSVCLNLNVIFYAGNVQVSSNLIFFIQYVYLMMRTASIN
jgi:chloramphenicol O-acetyltransferase